MGVPPRVLMEGDAFLITLDLGLGVQVLSSRDIAGLSVASSERFTRAILNHVARVSAVETKGELSVPLPFFCSRGLSGRSYSASKSKGTGRLGVVTGGGSFGSCWLGLLKNAFSSVSRDSAVIVAQQKSCRPWRIPCCISCVIKALLSPLLNCALKADSFQSRSAARSLKSSTCALMELLPWHSWWIHYSAVSI